MGFAKVLALQVECMFIMLDGLGVIAEFGVNRPNGLPDGGLHQRRAIRRAAEVVGDPVEQGADGKVAIRLTAMMFMLVT